MYHSIATKVAIVSVFVVVAIAVLSLVSCGKDDNEISLLEQACDRGDAEGCLNLGAMYYAGKGVKKDYSQAAVLFEKACSSGSADACYSLGKQYNIGIGVKGNPVLAAELYEKACSGGNADACYRLGEQYNFGFGLKQDYKKAVEFYRRALKLDKSYENGLKHKGIKLEKEPKRPSVSKEKKKPSKDTELPDDLGEL